MTSRIETPAAAAATGETADLLTAIRKSIGMVPNAYAAIGSLNTPALQAMLSADAALSRGVLSAQDRETVKLVVSAIAGCDYCVAAHSLACKASGIPVDTVKTIRALQPTGDAHRDALIRFVRALQESSGTIAQAELDMFRAAGFPDQAVVDVALAIAIITFTNVFNRANDTTVDFPALK
ncbi:carboxymuconolactone decarboxylase family protein [Rhizobium daejeonense]|uniref:Carboxymuconolactone decarboxylase family protein n=1 Tax=Rhizobium daejeonense TaxID=240521 RepID=A0A6M1S8Y9_9HYPH|nr:carboxymuconolactone decarboxylase family protein [Rhizobium daejeonense]NGO65907.1 carboxymuconolactone decarboxylase family protein [Rhizobium daejeonense]